jgi:hypothetical protein
VVLTFPDLIQVVQFFSSVHGFFQLRTDLPESRIAHFEVGLGFSLVPEHLIGEGVGGRRVVYDKAFVVVRTLIHDLAEVIKVANIPA